MIITYMGVSKIFIDTSAFVAMVDEGDQYHDDAIKTIKSLKDLNHRFLTNNLVVAESYTISRRISFNVAYSFLDYTEQARELEIYYIDKTSRELIKKFLIKYSDQNFSYADVASFILMHKRKISQVFTYDKHFQIAEFEIINNLT